jgi:hypothetical protein
MIQPLSSPPLAFGIIMMKSKDGGILLSLSSQERKTISLSFRNERRNEEMRGRMKERLQHEEEEKMMSSNDE